MEARASQVADTATQHAGARERLAEMLRGMRERAEAGSGRSVAEWVALLTRKAVPR